MYSGQSADNSPADWINILEEHFKDRKKAFLIFDTDHILKYLSQYAADLLEISINQTGVMTFSDLFPRIVRSPDHASETSVPLQKAQDITYTQSSGKLVDLRLTYDQRSGLNGYVIWMELRMKEFTGTYRKLSSLKSYSDLKHIFDSFEMGFMILDKNGTVTDINDHIKYLFRLPGDWIGKNLFTYPPLHQNKLSDFIQKCINRRHKFNSKIFKIKYSSSAASVNIHLSAIQLFDHSGNLSGALFCCKKEN